MAKKNLIKNIYLYLVSFVALMMIVMSTFNILDIALKTWVFTQSDSFYYEEPRAIIDNSELTEKAVPSKTEMEARQKQQKTADRHRVLSRSIATLVVSIPLFTLHWLIIRKREED